MSDLVPYLEEGVPGAGADRHAILCDAQTGHSVVVSSQNSCREGDRQYKLISTHLDTHLHAPLSKRPTRYS